MSERIVFIKVEDKDQIDTLADIAEEVWHEHFARILSRAQIDYMVEKFQSAPALTRQIGQEGYSYHLLLAKGVPVGYIGIKPDGDKLFLSKIYLLKAYRGLGYASQAFAFLEQLCREHGWRAIWLTVNRHNTDPIAVYEKKGFHTVRSQIADIGGGFVMDDYVMEKEVPATAAEQG